ncbi:hypothetical protein SETIT_J024500v2 [Setaria italica]|uniref:Uncharacterized protein n=1 Tax=Setaria italica TaxID=4555 RepID=A0A368PFS0_SETIT|nr:hypothetical protein SETIT_J024500v2 [Setaria italica]
MPPVSPYNELCLYWSVRCRIQLATGRTHRVKNGAAVVWYLTANCCRFRRCSSSIISSMAGSSLIIPSACNFVHIYVRFNGEFVW